jgi:hypothetical protein
MSQWVPEDGVYFTKILRINITTNKIVAHIHVSHEGTWRPLFLD